MLPSPPNPPPPPPTTWSKPFEDGFIVEKLARSHLAGLVLLFGCREENGKLLGAGIDSGGTTGGGVKDLLMTV